MTVSVTDLFSGEGWRVRDLVCSAGPGDRPFEERHNDICIAVVAEGTFRYRGEHGTAMLAPGTLLLGNEGTCFECGHEHGVGDRCISFHYTPEFMEDVLSGVPGAKSLAFGRSQLPPSTGVAPLAAGAEAARERGSAVEFEELAFSLAGGVAAMLTGEGKRSALTAKDERRIARAVRRIEASADQEITLAELAAEAGLSRYHFLRLFRSVAGTTPYQYVLHTRMRRAAVRLRATTASVATVAFEAGFNDLSTFNRRFRRVMGVTPQAYRAA